MIITEADVFILTKLGIKVNVGDELQSWSIPTEDGPIVGFSVRDTSWPESIAAVAIIHKTSTLDKGTK